MSMLLRALMAQKTGGDKPNLATVTEFTTEIDSTSGRVKIPVGLQAKIEKGRRYNVSFDVDVLVKSTSGNSNFTQIISQWPDQFFDIINWGYCSRGVLPGFTRTYHFEKVAKATNSDLEGIRPKMLQYDSSDIVGTYRAYNFIVTEV